MMKPDPKQLKWLIALIVVFALTVFIGNSMRQRPAAASSGGGPAKSVVATAANNDARIRVDLLAKPEDADQLGKNNPFVYRTRQTAAPVAPPQTVVTLPPPQPPPQPQPPRPMPPPPPPPIPLRFMGIAFIEPETKALIAFLTDDQQHSFKAMESDIVMGRYRVVKVTEVTVEVEDLEYSRRQTLPLIKQ